MAARKTGRGLLPCAAVLCALASGPASAKDAPLWEFGLGLGALAFEDYRGADTVHVYPIPVPYLVYNGRFLKADREGVRGTLFNRGWIELNLSGNATTPVRSNRARSGMPDLKSTVELGPSLKLHLFSSQDARVKLDFITPLRSAFTVGGAPRTIGWTLTPRFNLDIADPLGAAGWNFGVLLGPLFADRRYHDYFYTVAPQYATTARPAYQAAAGYAGSEAISAVSKRFPSCWVGAYVRYDTLAGAVFLDSPLVRRNSYWSAGVGISWMIKRSQETVQVPD